MKTVNEEAAWISPPTPAVTAHELSGKDKGGPSKGGFMNNRLCSYTALYLCNEINGVYKIISLFMNMMYYSGNHLY